MKIMSDICRTEVVREVLTVVRKQPKGSTATEICNQVKKRLNHLKNYVIRDAIRCALNVNRLERKGHNYFIPGKPTKRAAKVQGKTANRKGQRGILQKGPEITSKKEKMLAKSNSSVFIPSARNKKRPNSPRPDKLSDAEIETNNVIMNKSLKNTQKGKNGYRNVAENLELRNTPSTSSGQRSLLGSLATQCRRLFILPIIDPNCEMDSDQE